MSPSPWRSAWRAAPCPRAPDLRRYLLGLDKEALVAMLLDLADRNERLDRRLTLAAAQATGKADGTDWKRALDGALRSGGYVDYGGARDYADGIEEMLDRLEAMVRDGGAAGAIPLAEYAAGEIGDAMENVDDSDGWMGDLIHRAAALHLEACRRAPPDPADLAERLFALEIDSEHDAFHRAVLAYADLLGDTGLAAYRHLAETQWATVPPLASGADRSSRYGARFRITGIMEALAEQSGSLDERVAVLGRDLSMPHDFLRIAELYRDAGRAATALDWAERSWRAFPKDRDSRLRIFLANAWQAAGRREEAVGLMWDAFAAQPSLAAYQDLRRYAGRARPLWREKALAAVREGIARNAARRPERLRWDAYDPYDSSLLVEIFLHEGDVEAAWREAEAGGCSTQLRLRLADRRGAEHPADSVRVYKDHLAAVLKNAGDRFYHEAVDTLAKIEAMLTGAGQEAAFRTLILSIRTGQRRKRNLMKLLDRKGW